VAWYVMIALTILLALFVVLVHNTSWPRIIIVLSMPVLLYRYSSQDTRPPFTAAKAQAIQPTGSVRQISNALSQSEAKHYMQQGLSLMGTSSSGARKDPQALAQQSGPMGTQVAMIGPEVSHIMWERLAHLFEPIELSVDDHTIDQSDDSTLAGRWHPVGLNSCWRVSSFRPGQRCAPYTQSMDFGCEDGRVRSLQCLMFSLSHEAPATVDFFDEDGNLRLITAQLDCGSALVFNHKTQYQGGLVERGEQWILYTDVLYHQTAQAGQQSDQGAQQLAASSNASEESDEKLSAAQKKRRRKKKAEAAKALLDQKD